MTDNDQFIYWLSFYLYFLFWTNDYNILWISGWSRYLNFVLETVLVVTSNFNEQVSTFWTLIVWTIKGYNTSSRQKLMSGGICIHKSNIIEQHIRNTLVVCLKFHLKNAPKYTSFKCHCLIILKSNVKYWVKIRMCSKNVYNTGRFFRHFTEFYVYSISQEFASKLDAFARHCIITHEPDILFLFSVLNI